MRRPLDPVRRDQHPAPLFLTDEVQRDVAVLGHGHQIVPRFGAKMWHVDDGSGIVGLHAQHLARAERVQPLAGLQDGQGAQKPDGIKVGVMVHADDIDALFQLVHGLVTPIGRDVVRVAR